MEVEYAKSSLKTSLSQICVICQLLPFVRVGQYIYTHCPFIEDQGGTSSSVLSVFFTDKFYKLLKSLHLIWLRAHLSVKNTDKMLDEMPPRAYQPEIF